MFSLTMLPASEGDALVLTWGDKRLRHAFIDLGRNGDYARNKPSHIALGDPELFVITHIDADHIAGAVPMVAEQSAPFRPVDLWYNGHHHLVAAKKRGEAGVEPMGAEQAEKLSNGIGKFNWPWNKAFDGGPVSVDGEVGAKPIKLAGGLKITLLSPTDKALAGLIPTWEKELRDAALRPFDPDEERPVVDDDREHLSVLNVKALASMKFSEDTGKPNGTSIAFLAEYEGKTVLLGADAHPGLIEKSLRRLGYDESHKCKLACYKVSHHGSKKNTSSDLLGILDCSEFAFSTDGSHHNHPDAEAIARVLFNDKNRQKTLHFNFAQDNAKIWDKAYLCEEWNYGCRFPADGVSGISVDLTAGS